jgi:hypothetical protein
VMVALNFAAEPRRIEVPRAAVLLSTFNRGSTVSGSVELASNEAIILKIS